MNLKDRMLKFIEYKGLNPKVFEQSVNLSNGAVAKMGDNTRKSTIDKISIAYPDLNKSWLLTGEGEMLIQNDSRQSPDADESDSGIDYVPLLPVDAMAGSLSGFSQGVALCNCRKIKAPVNGADWAIQISGESMEPELHNGSYLYIKKLSGNFIPWGNILVIDTMDGVVVKKIYPIPGQDEYVLAKSINPDYPPFEIEKSCILGIYRILGGSFFNSTF